MGIAEDAYYGEKRRKLLEKAKKPKKQRAKTEKRKRTEKMNRSLSERKARLWMEQYPLVFCEFCDEPIDKYEDAAACHRRSRGMGGGKRNDDDIFLGHHRGNLAQGSQSLEVYLAGKTKEQLRKLCGVSE